MKLLFKTLYAFQGDPNASQLSFQAGELLVVDNPAKANVNGWAMGRRNDHTMHHPSGWFPLTYVASVPLDTHILSQNVDNSLSTESERDEGFGDAPMGGSWNSSGGSTPFGMGSDSTLEYNWESNSSRSFGSKISKVASKATSVASKRASKAAAITKSSLQEVGHRWNDMRSQRDEQLDRQAPSYHHQSQIHDQQVPHPQQSQRESNFFSGFAGMPGRVSTTDATTERNDGVTTSTITTTEQASGGFMPWIPGKKTTTTTTSTDSQGNQTIETTENRKGGFYIIPLGPVGLAACGAIAAKNAYDAQKAKKKFQGS